MSENRFQKWVSVSFFLMAVLTAFLCYHLSSQVFSFFNLDARIRNSDTYLKIGASIIGIVFFIVCMQLKEWFQFGIEVFEELSCVTWPTSEETRSVTGVVLVMVLCSGVLLGLMDYVWSLLIKRIL